MGGDACRGCCHIAGQHGGADGVGNRAVPVIALGGNAVCSSDAVLVRAGGRGDFRRLGIYSVHGEGRADVGLASIVCPDTQCAIYVVDVVVIVCQAGKAETLGVGVVAIAGLHHKNSAVVRKGGSLPICCHIGKGHGLALALAVGEEAHLVLGVGHALKAPIAAHAGIRCFLFTLARVDVCACAVPDDVSVGNTCVLFAELEFVECACREWEVFLASHVVARGGIVVGDGSRRNICVEVWRGHGVYFVGGEVGLFAKRAAGASIVDGHAALAVNARYGADQFFNFVVRKQIVGRDNRQIGNHAVIGFAGDVLVARADSEQLVSFSCLCHAAKFQTILIGIDVVDIIFARGDSCICLSGHGKGDEVPFVV